MRLRKMRFQDDKAVDIIKSMQVLKLDAVSEICKNINLNINKTYNHFQAQLRPLCFQWLINLLSFVSG